MTEAREHSGHRTKFGGTRFAWKPHVPLRFEWDPVKALENVLKHGVRFNEAETVFGDPLSRTINDPEHSWDESRMVTTGMSNVGRLLVVSHVDRGGIIRLINARPITAGERGSYEKKDRS